VRYRIYSKKILGTYRYSEMYSTWYISTVSNTQYLVPTQLTSRQITESLCLPSGTICLAQQEQEKAKIICVQFHPLLKPNSWTYNFIFEVSGHNLGSSQTWGFRLQCLHYKPVSNPLLIKWGGSKKSVNVGDCEKQGGKLLRLLSQLCPRIRPLVSLPLCVSCGLVRPNTGSPAVKARTRPNPPPPPAFSRVVL
jgi:hypothetical protein